MCAAILTLEAFLVAFAIAPAIVVSHTSGAVAGIGGGLLALLCVVAAGSLRRPGGWVLGFAVQVLLVLAGLATPLMYVLGTLFLVIYTMAFVLGRRMDQEKAARRVAEAALAARPGDPVGPA